MHKADLPAAAGGSADAYIFSGASTPRRAMPFFSTLLAASASFSRALSSAGS